MIDMNFAMKKPILYFLFRGYMFLFSSFMYAQYSRNYEYHEILRLTHLKKIDVICFLNNHKEFNRYYQIDSNKIVNFINFDNGSYYLKKETKYSNSSDSIFFDIYFNRKETLDSFSSDCNLNCITIYRIKFRKALFYRVKILKKEKIIRTSSFDKY
jgi:hypothetical protein